MEGLGTGGSPRPLALPPPAKDVDEVALALTKRARKRSRYLSPPYTDTDVREEEVAGEGPPPNVSAAEALSAVLAAALRQEQGQGVDPEALRFLTLYRNRNRASTLTFDTHPGSRAAAGGGSNKPPSPAAAGGGGGGHTMANLSAGPAMPRPGDGSPAPAKTKKNPQAPPAVGQTADGQIRAPKSAGFAVNAANGLANPAAKKKNYKKRMRSAGHEQQHFGNPVALVLDFAAGAPLPSKEDLVSTFRRFGSVIDSETAIAQDKHSARVAFATRAEAEAAFSCAGALGAFGPPSAVPSLQDLPPTVRGAPPPVPKLPLTDIRSNLEKMIASLNRRGPEEAVPAMGNLVGEMQGLLAKVDKMLQGRSATGRHHH
ncbi:hypothetical protein GQ55_3G141200 [Panicum hallii var. hallii]|uniref:Uncharacterized protein n=1 Tax=Panicum hallii var. hallii TaxID=1504633 RepID=A0A2T7E989_9POAL|nr:hypothetical protein GQ55_3G141200 [Panicum hallii var. hallii]